MLDIKPKSQTIAITNTPTLISSNLELRNLGGYKNAGSRRTTSAYFSLIFFFLILSTVVLYKTVYYSSTGFSGGFQIFWYMYSLLSGAFLLSRIPISYFHDNRKVDLKVSATKYVYPDVSFIIAAKNEEGSIYKTIQTCMESDYPANMECVAVDDGSTDGTYSEMERASKFFGERLVKAVTFGVNKGKREAMSEGVKVSNNEIVVFVDSDSFLEKGALKLLVHHFVNENVGAVSGNTKVANHATNMLTKMQSIRYAASYDIFKVCESYFGVVTCCPGCFSAYRRKAILPVIEDWRNQMFMGTRSTFGDDRSLTNFVLRTWSVEYCQNAKAETIVPEKYFKFLKQQLRWKKSWIREGSVAASFMWKKNPFASLSFYTNLILPTLGPIVVATVIYKSIAELNYTYFLIFIFGVAAVGSLFGAFLYFMQKEKYFYYMPLFSVFYTMFMIWQMPYAFVRINDTRWGTR